MRISPCFLVSFLLLSILISEVQGIRLAKVFFSVEHHKLHEGTVIKPSDEAAIGEAINTHCKDGHCSGMNRILMANPTATISKSDKNGGTKEESFSVDSPPVSGHREGNSEHYPDILDIAGMDYSPAKRKPPIHN